MSTDVASTATTANASSQSGTLNIVFIIAILVVLYFLMIRPQQKRAKEQQNLLSNLQKGDEVILSGGLMGRIVKLEDTILTIAVNDTTEMKFQKNAVVALLPKGSLKN